ncbi:GTP-binding protein TypA [Thiomicrospira aerophila AL3]|uniref:Large ribosomal subunit assembly factor BipA n=1 Tax=Thiomicrospira aerophila AL3 TaxID=717772 RepID=W0DSY0_9GAMM|nr:translational GTPase TypA [Thiomicrospira aerophila]AHF00383.1 GTP-binding protein TypA [Thiomicrospira aerophila AL3]
MSTDHIRNIAIIAHVDHGKTTLVDQLLRQSGTLDQRKDLGERVMDSNDQERERGITILSKNTAVNWNGYRINIVDTPGHADFGGEVERILSMVDSVLLLVDAVEGPMPQTRFVTQKALQQGLKPIVVVNKVDRDAARPDWVVDQTFDLFDRLGATDEQMDFPILFASGFNGYAGRDSDVRSGDMTPIFETIVEKVPAPDVDLAGPFQLQCISLAYDTYKGVIGTGRIKRGAVQSGMSVAVVDKDGNKRNAKIAELFGFHGLDRVNVNEAHAGDIVAFSGLDPMNISDTLCDINHPEGLPALKVDEPTVSMTFQVNTSPFVGQEGKLLTSRQIRERLDKELLTNVALRVEDTEDANKFRVSGRGELHLSVLIETMRREGFELGVSRPEVIFREIDGEVCEPYETLTVDVPEENQGTVMEQLGMRKAIMSDMVPDGQGRVRIDFMIPSRGLIGYRTEFMTATQGNGLIFSSFSHYGPKFDGSVGERSRGVLIAMSTGKALGFALFNLQERGRLFIGHGDEVYEGQVIGLHSRENDLTVNALKGKQLTNMRASGTDEAIVLTPPIRFTLEQALEFIDDDELVEVTPQSVRIRKKHLTENDRKRHSRTKAS